MEKPASLHDFLPELVATASVAKVDLVAHFAGPSGASDDHRDAVELRLQKVVILEVEHLVAEESLHDLFRFGALNLQGRDVGLPNLHVKAGVVGDPLGPEQHVAVGEGQPEMVLTQAKEHGVVDDAAVLGGNHHVLALSHSALREIPWSEKICKGETIRAGDFDLTLDTDIPHRDVIEELPVFPF